YKRPDNAGSSVKDGEMTIVYTRTNETADSYIEKVSADLKKQYRLLVATSDELIQNAVFAHGALRISARELEMRLEGYSKNLKNL
ncbi:MAG: NYN domain-containing protein, partial [Erysipelotrichales bacterium]|nr:NYN domain-containing protein [Erysipelotrichales bacterium]